MCPPPPSDSTNSCVSIPSLKRSCLSRALMICFGVTMLSSGALAVEVVVPTRPHLNSLIPEGLPTTPTLALDDSSQATSGGGPSGSNYWLAPEPTKTTGNFVTSTANKSDTSVVGGWSGTEGQNVHHNRVWIKQGAVADVVSGGAGSNDDSDPDSVTYNYVEIEGTVANAYGGNAYKAPNGVSNNVVVVKAGARIQPSTSDTHPRYIIGGKNSSGEMASGNVVVVEEGANIGTLNLNIFGADGSNNADNNAVYIFGEVTGRVAGSGAYNTSKGNMVWVSGTVTGDVNGVNGGGREQYNNLVVIDSGKVIGNAAAANNPWDNADGNAIYLLGTAVVEGRAAGIIDAINSQDTFRGKNSLAYIEGTVKVGSLEGFDTLYLKLTDENVSTAALTLTSTEAKWKDLNIKNTNVVIDGSGLTDTTSAYQLISFANVGSLTLDENTAFTDQSSVFVDATWMIDQTQLTDYLQDDGSYVIDAISSLVVTDEQTLAVTDENGTVTTITSASQQTASENSKTLAESFLGSIAFVNQGSEFIADEGLRAM